MSISPTSRARRSRARASQDPLHLRPHQRKVTPEQEVEARRFALERIAAQLSTTPVDEAEAERWLCQVYEVAKLPPPTHIRWLDGPLQLVACFLPDSVWASVGDSVRASVRASVRDSVRASVRASVRDSVGASVWASVRASVWASVRASVRDSVGASVRDSVRDSVWASLEAPWLAFYHFFDIYLAPNDLRALAHFNEMVSGYWLGRETVLIVRRPRILARDAQGRLHSATGKCMEYHDGWGFYAWHGVRVPERVILQPDALTRQDFLEAENIEVRRVIGERMGQRFVPELGGVLLDHDPQRGDLYEVRLPDDDPERVARYVQVQDASTPRQYFLRVPPDIQTAAAAVAWTFSTTIEAYQPLKET